jgi:hypothetical protein
LPQNTNPVFHRAFIPGGIGPGETGIGLQLFPYLLMIGKRFVVIKGQRFNEGRGNMAKLAGNTGGRLVGLPRGYTK